MKRKILFIGDEVMFFTKNFRFSLDKGLELVNQNELEDYIGAKIKYFSEYKNYSSKEEKLKLLDEIVQMCDYDQNTAIFDYSHMPVIEGINIVDLQSNMIYFYNLAYILGGNLFKCI